MKTDLTLRVPRGRTPMTFAQHDANFQRLMYWSGPWVAGTYEAQEVVSNNTILWIANKQTTQEPSIANLDLGISDWDALSRSPYGYGEMKLTTPKPGTDLGLTWDPITYFDVSDIQENIVMDPVTGNVTFSTPGLWEFNFMAAFTHNESNAGRTTYVRVYNVSDAVASSGLLIPIGRNQPATSTSTVIWFSVTPDEVGDSLRFEVGGGDAVTTVNWESLVVYAKRLA